MRAARSALALLPSSDNGAAMIPIRVVGFASANAVRWRREARTAFAEANPTIGRLGVAAILRELSRPLMRILQWVFSMLTRSRPEQCKKGRQYHQHQGQLRD